MSRREKKAETENRRRIINYIVVAALAALIVTVLFLVFGRSDKTSSVNKSTNTEQVTTPGANNSATTISRPTRPSTINRQDRTDSVVRPTNTTTVTNGRVDHPQTTKMDIVNGANGTSNSNTNSQQPSNRRGGKRVR